MATQEATGAPPVFEPTDETSEVQSQRNRPDEQEIINTLNAYRHEGELGRKSGANGRDNIWRENWDIYWGRFDFTKKAEWQAKVSMPEASNFVDRWAAAMRDALMGSEQFFSVEDPADQNRNLVPHVEKLMKVLLSRCGRTHSGHPMDFAAVFEDQMKLGSISCMCAAVTWQDTPDGGYVACESVDPFTVWLDPTGRRMYRIRRSTIDMQDLMSLVRLSDREGEPIYDEEQIMQLAASLDEEGKESAERITGYQQDVSSNRKTIKLDEYLATIVDQEGRVVDVDALTVIANDRFVIRGPEPNPFWHERDWIVMAPLVTVPFSVYGRSYMEDWSSVATAFTEMTNLILDGAFTQAINAYVMQPDMLADPSQASEGISPNKGFMLAEGMPVADFLKEIELGRLGREPVEVWQALKNEIRDGAKLNEIALGQLAVGEKTATEVAETQQASSAIIRSIARTIESRFLEPVLTLMWQTALQHMDFSDPKVSEEIGEETAAMLQRRREEFSDRNIKFRVRGISELIDRQAKLRGLMGLLQTVGANELLLQEFFQTFSPTSLLRELVRLHGVDPLPLMMTDQERQMRETAAQMAGGGEEPARTGGSPPRPQGQNDGMGGGGL